MLELLTEIMGKRTLASIYVDTTDTSRFIFGIVLGVDDKHIAILMLSPEGDYDGLLVKQTSEIYRIEIDDSYAHKMKKLCNIDKIPVPEEFFAGNRVLESLLDYAQKTKKVISCELANSGLDDVVGILESVKNDVCCIKQINALGYENGYSFFCLGIVSQLSCDSKDEQIIMRLWKENSTL